MRTFSRLRTTGVLTAAAIAMVAVLLAALTSGTIPGTSSHSIEAGGRTRNYLVHLPRDYDPRRKLPLVLVFHGASQDPAGVERMSGMSALADRENFLAAYPEGLGRVRTWNAGNCCGYALQNKTDDVGFVRTLLDTLAHQYPVDRRRVFVTGISNGAMLSYRLACELSDRITAIAPVEGAQNVDCHPLRPVSVIVFHGTADRLVPFNGGSTPFQIGPHRVDASVADTVGFWAKQDGCASNQTMDETAVLRTTTYSGCKDGAGVALYAIQGGRHMWPGHALSGNDVQATRLMWSFFIEHSR